MGDVAIFGDNLFHRGSGRAAKNGLSADYEVIVLDVHEGHVSATVRNRLRNGPELTRKMPRRSSGAARRFRSGKTRKVGTR